MRKSKIIKSYLIVIISFTVAVAVLGFFFFRNSFPRLLESFSAFWSCIKYYFAEMFLDVHDVPVSINDYSAFEKDLIINLPESWELVKANWSVYWTAFASPQNISLYFESIGQVLYDLSYFLLMALPVVIIFIFIARRIFNKHNQDYNVDSKPLKAFKRFVVKVFLPVKRYLIGLWQFFTLHKVFIIINVVSVAVYFNLVSVVLNFLGFYFYFIASFDFVGIYVQFVKLFYDLTPVIKFIPTVIWLVIGFAVLDYIRKKIAYGVLNHFEMKNRGFINERPVVSMDCATMGKKKTTMITDMALSQEVMLRDKAFEKILENDLKFPFFPWINLELVLKTAIKQHIIYNLATCRKFIDRLYFYYYTFETSNDKSLKKCLLRHLRKRLGYFYSDMLFGYDRSYGTVYNDELKVTDIWEVIKTYSQLYFIYIIQSSLIISNYSVRVDNVLSDLGNFPLWDTDFFKKDSRLIDSYSRHAHILDFDALRLGRKFLEENPNKDSFEFGVILITEVGKERGNTLELVGKNKNDDSANQKNDLFNAWLKMVRHSATVDNFPFVKVITDEQRPESWGADARDLCQIITIIDSGESKLAMPFFAVGEVLHAFVFGKFSELYYKYRYIRSDNTLLMYLFKNVTARLHKYYTNIYNRFGYCTLNVVVEEGTQDGSVKKNKYYLMNKKIYSKRFSTDCFSDFFTEKALRSAVGLDDLREFETEKATLTELDSENSYFMRDLVNGFKRDK